MKCPACGSENVNIGVMNTATLRDTHHSLMWWIFIGWWWVPAKWIVFTIPALILKLFTHKKQKIVNMQVTTAVCQNCGHTWQV